MDRKRFISEYVQWLEQGTAALFVGAGISRQAGYPDWRALLKDIADELKINIDQEHDLAGVAQWYINKTGRQRARIAQVVKNSFPDKKEVPSAYRIMARLPVRYVWTTNYDKLVERAWELQRRRLDVKASKSDLSVSDLWADTTLYKMHGTVEHASEVVIATDDYELYRQTRAGFLQVLNGHLIGLHCLFLGFSFTDPNIGHLLAIIRESMGEHATSHYAILRKPQKGKGKAAEELWAYENARHTHWVDDLQRYGINCVEIDEYREIDEILLDIESAAARRSIFVSGSFPPEITDASRVRIEEIASGVGQIIAEKNLRLVSGFGLTVGSAVLSGALGRLYAEGVPSLDRSLFLRPFPQVIPDGFDRASFQKRYREDMIQQAGVCTFIGGIKAGPAGPEIAPGVLEEYEIAKTLGKVIIPVAASGGAVEEIWKRLKAGGGPKAARLSKSIFERLGAINIKPVDAVAAVKEAIEEATKG